MTPALRSICVSELQQMDFERNMKREPEET